LSSAIRLTAGRSTTDAILTLHLLSELHREFNRPLNVTFVDIKSAFNSVDHTARWKALHSKGMPDIILHQITALHENTGARIRVRQKLSPRISTTSGVRNGCILAPILFRVAIDWITQHMSFNPCIIVGSSTFTDLVYVDEPRSATDATTSLKSFSDSASHLGLNISSPKTKLQNNGSGPKPPDISVESNTVKSVDSFVYLGCLQSSDGQCRPDLTCRIGLACSVKTSLKWIWGDKCQTLDTKLHIRQTLALSMLLYAADTWTLPSADVRTLNAFHQKCETAAWNPMVRPSP